MYKTFVKHGKLETGEDVLLFNRDKAGLEAQPEMVEFILADPEAIEAMGFKVPEKGIHEWYIQATPAAQDGALVN